MVLLIHNVLLQGLIGKADFITALGEERGAHLLCTPQMVCGKDRHVLFFHIDHGETINVVAFTTDRSRYPDWPGEQASIMREYCHALARF